MIVIIEAQRDVLKWHVCHCMNCNIMTAERICVFHQEGRFQDCYTNAIIIISVTIIITHHLPF